MNAHPVPEAVAARPAGATPADDVLRLYSAMLRVRRFEERCVELYSAARIRGFMHVYIGEEAVAAGVCDALRPDDAVVATYREHGHALLRGMPARAVMAEMFGKVTGCCRGRGGSMHLFDVERRFFGGNAIVGGGLPVAVGLALADRMRGLDRVTVCFFGEGAMAEGEWHESMNLAALWRLPVLFVCENNLYAMGTALDRSESETNLAVKAAAYEVPAWTVDGMDVLAVADHARRAVEAIRGGAGPHFLEARTYRFRAHSMYDPERYRPKDEVARWRERDPLGVLVGAAAAAGVLGADVLARLEDEVRAEVDDAVTFAEESPVEDVADLPRWVVHPSSTAVPAGSAPTGSGPTGSGPAVKVPSEEAPR